MKSKILQLNEGQLEPLRKMRDMYLNQGLVYGWRANSENKNDQGHWNKMLLNNSKHFPYDHGSMPYIQRHTLLKGVWEQIQLEIGPRALLRTYINGYTYGTDGYVHRDDPWIPEKFGKDSLSETIIVYLNDTWNIDWSGETVIFDNDKEIELSVLPKFGRILVFDSNKEHAARPVSRVCKELRTVLVFKTIDYKSISQEVGFILARTNALPHSGRTFFEHLYGTAMKLEQMKCSQEVCLAGLYHSVYGTEFYKFFDPSINREVVKKLIGEYSESLVYEFCTTADRHNTFVNNAKGYEDKFLKDLITIEIANLLDQNSKQQYNSQIEMLKQALAK